MTYVSGVQKTPGRSFEAVMESLKQCAYFDMHGLVDAGVVRVRTGQEPEVLSSIDGLLQTAKELGKPVNDKRSIHSSEWKPTNAQMFKNAMHAMQNEQAPVVSIAPKGPKLG